MFWKPHSFTHFRWISLRMPIYSRLCILTWDKRKCFCIDKKCITFKYWNDSAFWADICSFSLTCCGVDLTGVWLVSSQCSSAGSVMLLVLFSLAIFRPWPAPLQNTNQDTAKGWARMARGRISLHSKSHADTWALMLNLVMFTIKQSDWGEIIA